ncbi:transglutaminase family protein [Aquabacterium fontiphilum]|uniref:transglutaminase family protein n=1 Tax=Aquabacterium fontiphilum TaxID=450365 RepID=UPI001376A141|nr:transglutaminase family protein [Aquabacterium fontiphilum]NBD21843.1 transglutaminase family protein [Aquabacterium fontiphilum]
MTTLLPDVPAASEVARLTVEHETCYEYAQPVDQAQHIACLRPLSDAGQTLLQFDMAVSPAPAQHSLRRDVHGNSRAYFALHAPHHELKVVARSVVAVRERYAGLDREAGPRCADVRERLVYRAQAPFVPASEFLFASPYAPVQSELKRYADVSLRPERPLVAAVLDLMHRIHADFEYAPASTDISTPVVEVLRQRKGVCQDFAHLMIACLRSWGLAARYVSGYLLTQPPPGQAPLVGADASHAWVSVWVPGLAHQTAGEWLDLDPTNDCVPGRHHVRVAQGRDFGDVTPLRGVIRGGGRHTLLVRVTTRLQDIPGSPAV